MRIDLHRKWFGPKATISAVDVDGKPFCWALEDVVREVPGQPVETWKVHGETAIPTGTYKVVMSYSTRFKAMMPELVDVPGYTGVRIHPGNTDADTEGCILPGTHVANADMITNSRAAYMALFGEIMRAREAGESVSITLSNEPTTEPLPA